MWPMQRLTAVVLLSRPMLQSSAASTDNSFMQMIRRFTKKWSLCLCTSYHTTECAPYLVQVSVQEAVRLTKALRS